MLIPTCPTMRSSRQNRLRYSFRANGHRHDQHRLHFHLNTPPRSTPPCAFISPSGEHQRLGGEGTNARSAGLPVRVWRSGFHRIVNQLLKCQHIKFCRFNRTDNKVSPTDSLFVRLSCTGQTYIRSVCVYTHTYTHRRSD